MNATALHSIAGLAGVSGSERPHARRWARRFEMPMLIVALWIPIQWYLEAEGDLPRHFTAFADWFVWAFFFVETSVMSLLVKDRRRYLAGNWLNLAIILGGLPIIWNVTPLAGLLRSLRLLLMVGILARFSRNVRRILAYNRLGATLGVSLVVIILSGILISGIDPAIKSPWDGIWWAWVTVTTVGYGDVVPTSPAGRLFGALLILLGVGLFSLLTANFSSFFIQSGFRKVERSERSLKQGVAESAEREEALDKGVGILEKEQNVILNALHDIQLRLDRIEQRMQEAEQAERETPPRR